MSGGPLSEAVIAAARAAQAGWAKLTTERRAELLAAAGKAFAARAEEVARVACEETQKRAADAWFADVVPNLDLFDYWTAEGLAAIAPEDVALSRLKFPGKRARLLYEPKGMIGLITPWNYPAALPLRSLLPALVSGNVVLFKPSEVAPRTGALLAEIFNAVLPAGVLTLVQGAGDAGQAVVDAADHVIFTGSVATGRRVAMRCAEQLKTVSLELGGKDAAIVLTDCDLPRTAQGVFWSAVSNSGQNCSSIERVYVERPLYQRLVDALQDMARKVNVAPVATAAQDKTVRRHLEGAVASGAQASGDYPGAVVLTDVPADHEALTEETFGPLIPVIAVDSAEQAVARANASRFGLTASIWTKDTARAERLAAALDVGTVTINNASLTGAMPFAPWSGRKESGSGVTNSALAIREMVHPKFVLVDESKDPEVWWFPLSEPAVDLARTTLSWLTASGLSKVGKTLAVLRGMKARQREIRDWFERA